MTDQTTPILLLEPNVVLRRAIHEVLASEEYGVVECDSLEDVLHATRGDPASVALVAWQSMEGLLAEEHRHRLAELTRRVRLVLMVPRRWQRLLVQSEFGFADLVAKPFTADELLDCVRSLLSSSVPQAATASD